MTLRAPFPAFGGKRDVADMVWQRLGSPKQYIEPFCFSAAVLLAAPSPASLEIIGDTNGFVANFWRATIHQPAEVARYADYPVSHIDLGARHVWLMAQRDRLGTDLQDPNWPGDAKAAGWWLWGQCCWIGSGWCEWNRAGKIPHVSDAGRGVQAAGQIPHVGNAGMGGHGSGADTACESVETTPHATSAGQGIQAIGQVPHATSAGRWTSGGRVAWDWLHRLAARLERVRVVHGDWSRTLNHHYGANDTAVFLDPPYDGFEGLYRSTPIAQEVSAWCRDNSELRIALCGHRGDYDLPGWDVVPWKRKRLTYAGAGTTDREAIWFSPACLPACGQGDLFGRAL